MTDTKEIPNGAGFDREAQERQHMADMDRDMRQAEQDMLYRLKNAID